MITNDAVAPTPLAGRPAFDQVDALDQFGRSLAKKRREAIDGRAQLGIEIEWREDEESYIGVDDANRAEYRSTWMTSAPSPSPAFTTINQKTVVSTKSTILINITRPYCDAAASRIADMLFPVDDRCWGIQPSPIPDLDRMGKSQAVAMLTQDGAPITEQQIAEEIQEIAKERACRAQIRIDDWLQECQWSMTARHTIEDAARLGTGVMKGPVPRTKTNVRWQYDAASDKMVRTEQPIIVPETRWVDPWNLFPDPACGNNIQDGEYVFERDHITVKRLLALRKSKGYLAHQIDACILEGAILPEAIWTPSIAVERNAAFVTKPFEIWYYTGIATIEDLQAAGVDTSALADNREPKLDYVNAIVTMVNHRVIHAALTPLDDESFPYDIMVWQKRPGMPWGIGVARQIRVAQRMLTAAARNLMDNAALSGGPQVVINTKAIVPVNGSYDLVPRKAWIAADGAEEVDVDKAFRIFSIETRQQELMAIITFALRMAEESTGLPMILQGQSPQGGPGGDTLGGLKLLQNNASSVLRRLARLYDDGITIQHIGRYYQWLMEHGEDEEEKGDNQVIARGSSTLVERDLQNQEITLILPLSLQPQYNLDPKKCAEEYLRTMRFDPKRFQVDDDLKTQNAPKPPTPEELQQQQQQQEAQQAAADSTAKNEQAQAAAAQKAQLAEAKVLAENQRAAALLADKAAERQSREALHVSETNSKHAIFNAEAQLKTHLGSGVPV